MMWRYGESSVVGVAGGASAAGDGEGTAVIVGGIVAGARVAVAGANRIVGVLGAWRTPVSVGSSVGVGDATLG